MDNLISFFQTAKVAPQQAGESLWLIIALPLLGAFICGTLGKVIGRANTNLVALSAVFGSFLISVLVFWTTVDGNVTQATYAVGHEFGTWFQAGSFRVNFGLAADHLSGSMLLVITGVGFLIHVYSTGYMAHDPGYWRFFAYLNLFVAAMLTLVLADSLPLLFVGWEGVGLCSYLLIGFWYDDPAKAYAGRKAFITNRIGDFGFLLGSFMLVLMLDALGSVPVNELSRSGQDGTAVVARLQSNVKEHGHLAFITLEDAAKALPKVLEKETEITTGPLHGQTFGAMLTVVTLLMMLGAAGKSAQIPLYVWLPDAMAGPTPVSALIHAATMVTSGVYLFCRISWLVVLAPKAMAVIAIIGAATALWAALIAFSQTGLKKVLAYSTVSQLGLMFLGIGSGIFWAAFLHVVTHAFFKACLFLGAGSVMHGNGDEEDITKLGGVRKEMKWTWATFLVATLAITGIVPLSGFFSKDAILHAAHVNELSGPWGGMLHIAYWMGVLSAGCTAFYMVRLYWLTFEGERSKDARVPHAHESGPAMTVPLVILAVLSVVFLLHGLPLMPSARGEGTQVVMENFLDPVFRTTYKLVEETKFITLAEDKGLPWGVWAQAWGIALFAGFCGFLLYSRIFPGRKGQADAGLLAFTKKLTFNKFYVDEVYTAVLIRPTVALSKGLYKVVDAIIIDTVGVRGTAWLTARTGAVLRYFQTGDAQSYAAVMALALASGLLWALVRFTVMP